MFKNIRLGVLAVVLPVFFMSVTVDMVNASNMWEKFHWARTQDPFTVTLVDKTSKEWDSPVEEAAKDWSLSNVLDIKIVEEKVSKNDKNQKNCDPIEGRVVVCNAEFGDNNWLGLSEIWLDGDHITKATIKINDTYFRQERFNTQEWRNYITCHEMGHILGLDHADSDYSNIPLGTCLDLVTNPTVSQHPNQGDYDSLELIYAHLDEFSTTSSIYESKKNKKGGANK